MPVLAADATLLLITAFNEPGEYAVRVEDIASNGGAGYVYHLDVRPTKPRFCYFCNTR